MTDALGNIYFMDAKREGWKQIPGKALHVSIYNIINLVAVSPSHELIIKPIPKGPLDSSAGEWISQGLTNVEKASGFPYSDDVWYCSKNEIQSLYKWNLKAQDATRDDVITSVLDLYVRDRVYINRMNIVCSRGRDNKDWVCSNTVGDVHVLYVAASNANFYYMDINYRLFYTPLPLLYTSKFVDTGYTSQFSRGMGVPLDGSLPFVIQGDGTVDETFCLDTRFKCGDLGNVQAPRPVPGISKMENRQPESTAAKSQQSLPEATSNNSAGESEFRTGITSVSPEVMTIQVTKQGPDGIITVTNVLTTTLRPVRTSTPMQSPTSSDHASDALTTLIAPITVGIVGCLCMVMAILIIIGVWRYRRVKMQESSDRDFVEIGAKEREAYSGTVGVRYVDPPPSFEEANAARGSSSNWASDEKIGAMASIVVRDVKAGNTPVNGDLPEKLRVEMQATVR
ncbi:hypothetical protein HDU97_004512 [Phlyctochytrium planicorne]|nr:hypothetical protein HDU97_004512 [Phlyctochytrium planicorne]